MSDRGTVYVLVDSQFAAGDLGGSLMRDTGEVVWSHLSSSLAWLQRDLTTGFSDRRKQLESWYPDGYDVVVIGIDDEIPADVLARNYALGKADEAAS